jgi:ribokinase
VRLDLVAVGEVMLDVGVATLAPGEVRHEAIRLRVGGTAVNAAVAAAAVGARTAVVGRVGADAAAEAVRAHMRAAGVEPLLATDPVAPTGVFVETAVAGARTVAVDRGASDTLEAGDLPAVTAAATLVSGHVLFHEGTRPGAVAALSAFGSPVVAVTAASAAVLGRLGAQALRARAEGARIFFANDAEARALTGLDGEAAALELARLFDTVCVTMGAAGAVAASQGRLERALSSGGPDADALGTGDAFAGALVTALAAGRDLADALGAGVAAGARAARAGTLR